LLNLAICNCHPLAASSSGFLNSPFIFGIASYYISMQFLCICFYPCQHIVELFLSNCSFLLSLLPLAFFNGSVCPYLIKSLHRHLVVVSESRRLRLEHIAIQLLPLPPEPLQLRCFPPFLQDLPPHEVCGERQLLKSPYNVHVLRDHILATFIQNLLRRQLSCRLSSAAVLLSNTFTNLLQFRGLIVRGHRKGGRTEEGSLRKLGSCSLMPSCFQVLFVDVGPFELLSLGVLISYCVFRS